MSFAYEEERTILKDVAIDIATGGMTALVGVSGCGKSTIAGILMGRNKGYQGHVFMQGQELSDITEKSLMEHVTLVSHNSYLFKGTVRQLAETKNYSDFPQACKCCRCQSDLHVKRRLCGTVRNT